MTSASDGKRKAADEPLLPSASVEEVKAWLTNSGVLDECSLASALEAIENEGIDGETLLSMTEQEICALHSPE